MDLGSLKWKKLYADAILPQKAHESDAAYDLSSYEDVVVPAGEGKVIGTGVIMAFPVLTASERAQMGRLAGLVCSRSGLAAKHGLTVLNAPGVIDESYTGELKVILFNHSKIDFKVEKGNRIAQLLLVNLGQFSLYKPVLVDKLQATERGDKGLGSTGI